MSSNSLWSWTVAAGNNNVTGALFKENQTRSSLNDGARQVQAEVRTWANDPGWIQYGDGDGTATYAQVSGDSFTVAGANVTATYHQGRRVKAVGSSTGTIYGTILSSSFSTNTTVVVDWDDSGALVSETITIWLAAPPELAPQTPAHAASRPNLIVNGQFLAWTAGTTLTSLADGASISDGAYLLSNGSDTADISKETTVKPVGAPAALKAEVETANRKFGFLFPLNAADSKMLIGGTASLSFKARGDSGNSTISTVRAALITWSSTADAYTVDVVSAWGAAGANPTLIANWTYENTPFDITLAASTWKTYRIQNVAIDTASAANVAVFIWVDDTDGTVDDLLYLADIKVEPGPVATPIPRLPASEHAAIAGGFIWGGVAGGTANALTISLVSNPVAYEDGMPMRFLVATPNTGAATINANGIGAIPLRLSTTTELAHDELMANTVVDAVYVASAACAIIVRNRREQFPRGYLDGYQMSLGSDASHDVQVSPGAARSSDNTTNIELTSALVKQIDAAWAAGTNAGGMDTGSVAADTVYYLHAIKRIDTFAEDVLFSLSATSPTLPTNWTKSRYIGEVITDGSANIIAFSQDGDRFLLDVPVEDFNDTIGTTASLETLSVPPSSRPIFTLKLSTSGSTEREVLVTGPAQTDTAPSSTAYNAKAPGTGQNNLMFPGILKTDSSSRIRLRSSNADVSGAISTLGWVSMRGKDATT